MIGVFGGTFDPVHFGHLRPALDCLQQLRLEQIRFIPLNVAVHRPQPLATSAQRLAMLEAAIANQPGFVVDPRELARPGGSYSYDTLASLRAELGADRPLCLLIGADAFDRFLSWHRPLEILGLAHLIVMRRPGHDAPGHDSISDPQLRALYLERRSTSRDALSAAPSGCILFQDVTQIEVSSTQIRQLIGQGRSPRYLLPDAVLSLIERAGLYRSSGSFALFANRKDTKDTKKNKELSHSRVSLDK